MKHNILLDILVGYGVVHNSQPCVGFTVFSYLTESDTVSYLIMVAPYLNGELFVLAYMCHRGQF